jgi:hypothetical protein
VTEDEPGVDEIEDALWRVRGDIVLTNLDIPAGKLRVKVTSMSVAST